MAETGGQRLPKYVQRFARLPRVFEVLAARPEGMSLAELGAAVDVEPGELHTDLLAFYTADVNPRLFGLSMPAAIEFFSADTGDEVDPNVADWVRLTDDRPAEAIGVEHVDAGELALVYTAAVALAETEPDNADLAAAIDALTDAVGVDESPEGRAPNDFVSRLRDAVESRHRVRIEYSRAWKEGVIERVIEPYRLIRTRRGWEVDSGPADDQGRLRTYLVVHIRTLDVLDETFVRPADVDARLAAQRTTRRVRVQIPHDARWAADFHAEQVHVVEQDETDVVLDLDLLPPVDRRLGLLLLAAGLDSAVLDPQGLVRAGPDLARVLLAHHRGSDEARPPE